MDNLTTEPLTTKPLTTEPLTTKALTTEPLTTEHLTTKLLTTESLTTQASFPVGSNFSVLFDSLSEATNNYGASLVLGKVCLESSTNSCLIFTVSSFTALFSANT